MKKNKMPWLAFTRDVRLCDILRYSKSYRKWRHHDPTRQRDKDFIHAYYWKARLKSNQFRNGFCLQVKGEKRKDQSVCIKHEVYSS